MDTCKTGVVIESLTHITFQCGKSLDTLRILCIIPRTMFGKSTVGRFGQSGFDFQHYEEKGYFDNPGPRLGCTQVESLHKHAKNGNTFPEVVLLDEIEAILKQLTSYTTHKTRLCKNFDTFCDILLHAKKVIVMDAMVTQKTIHFLLRLFARDDIQLFINEVRLPYTVQLYSDKGFFFNNYYSKVKAKDRMYLFSGSLTRASEIYKTVKEMTGDKARIYSSESGEAERDELRSPDDHWINHQQIVATATVTVGSSFNIPNVFESCWAYCVPSTTGPQDVIQATRRVREPINKVLHMHVKVRRDKDLPLDAGIIRDRMLQRGQLVTAEEQNRLGYVDVPQAAESKHKKLLLDLAAMNEMQNNLAKTDYVHELLHQLYELEYTVQIVRSSDTQPEVVEQKEKHNDELDSMKDAFSDRHLDQLIKLGTDPIERERLEKAQVESSTNAVGSR